MYRRAIATAAIAILAVAFFVVPATSKPQHSGAIPCPTKFKFGPYVEHNASAAWRGSKWEQKNPVGPGRLARQQHWVKCAKGPGHREAMRDTWTTQHRQFARYRGLRRIAPYYGNGAWWSIPSEIVACESGYSWNAYNPSGAVGPYQLLGWGAPYPADTWAEKMENHRIAADVYAGGAGRSNWVC